MHKLVVYVQYVMHTDCAIAIIDPICHPLGMMDLVCAVHHSCMAEDDLPCSLATPGTADRVPKEQR